MESVLEALKRRLSNMPIAENIGSIFSGKGISQYTLLSENPGSLFTFKEDVTDYSTTPIGANYLETSPLDDVISARLDWSRVKSGLRTSLSNSSKA